MIDNQTNNKNPKRHKEVLISLLTEFDRICNKYELRYFLTFGTAIGAIRHKGMIPWDDDIDVEMPRPDYEKLLNLPEVTFPKEYKLCSFRNTKNYYHDNIKFEALNTTLIENVSPILYIGGVCIDIFPLDGTPNNIKEREIQCEMIQKRMLYIIKRIYTPLTNSNNFKQYLFFKYKQLFNNYKSLLKKYDEFTSKYSYNDSDIVCNFHALWYKKAYNNKHYYDEYMLVPFENGLFRISKYYDLILTKMYGDYMTPPPENERVSSHNYLFLDLNKRFTREELSPFIERTNKQLIYKPLSHN